MSEGMIPSPIEVIAVVQEILETPSGRYHLKLYSKGSSIPRIAKTIEEFELFENGYVFLFSGGIKGLGYFEVWVKYTPLSKTPE